MIDFGNTERWMWDGNRETIRFQVIVDGAPITCLVSQECIQDNMGNPREARECMDAAKRHFDQITDRIGRLIASGRFEEDGATIILRTLDW